MILIVFFFFPQKFFDGRGKKCDLLFGMMILVFMVQFAKFELEDILDGPFDMMLQVYERLNLFSMLVVVSWITLLGCVCLHACKHVLQVYERLALLGLHVFF